MPATPRVLIIGAGLAGLACARRLFQSDIACTVLEASHEVGGRVRTDWVNGFQLDRGFQVLLTGYPEVRHHFDLPSLDLQPFRPGALVRHGDRFHRVSDPLRRPQDVFETLASPIGSLADKYRVLRLTRVALRHELCPMDGSWSTLDLLRRHGFSEVMLDRFFRPFLGGVFLDDALSTPCWIFEQVWAAFARGSIALPRDGMAAVAAQLAGGLPVGTIRAHRTVERIDGTCVVLASGEWLASEAVVVATDHATAGRLLGDRRPHAHGRESITVYFDAPVPPIRGPWLVVNGEGDGPVRTLCVLSEVAPSYAPAGRALVSVGLSERATGAVRECPATLLESLRGWFGPTVDAWRHLRTDRVTDALPPLSLLASGPSESSPLVAAGCYLCGDYRESGTLDGALLSGRKAAEAVITALSVKP
jgi:phytoene dehydrogenase-like protein